MTTPEVRELLATLRESGVRRAVLSDQGAVLEVEFQPPAPAAPKPQVSTDTPQDRALANLIELAGRPPVIG
jgi:hypothetical protein